MKLKLERVLMPEPVSAGMNPLVIMSLAYMLRSSTEDAPPIIVRRDGENYRLIDGRHRLVAHHVAGRRTIKARIEE